MSAKRSDAKGASPPGSRSTANTAATAATRPATKRRAEAVSSRDRATTSKSAAKLVTRAGRERMNLLVNPELLAIASAALGTKNKSDAVNAALLNAAENAAILRGIDAAIGIIPDFPDIDT